MTIELPHNLELRDYQIPAWQYIINGGKRACLMWHRRAGKDLLSFNAMIEEAVYRVGNYWYILPYYTQARKAIWEARTKTGMGYLDCIPPGIAKLKNDMSIRFNNGSIIRILGGDKPDSLAGASPRGTVVSEWALQRPSLWTNILEPMLAENDGWVLFNSTPRGNNHFTETFDAFEKDPECFSSIITIDDSHVVTEEQINEMRRKGTPEEIIQQEYYCSREGAILGSYYGDMIKQLTKNKQITTVPYDGQSMIHTYWDLGIDDCTAIWFVQFVGKEIRFVDYYENNNKGLTYYVDMLINSKDYAYGSHNLPHDGNKRELGTGESIKDMIVKAGLTNVKVHPRTANVYNDIIKGRAVLPRCWFDTNRCKEGIEALKQYRREWDENKQTFKQNPLHDWSSHGADAFRLFAQSFTDRQQKATRKPVIAEIGKVW